MNLSRYWTGSTEWQDNSLDGQSPKNFITQWCHELSNPDIENGEFTIYSLAELGTAYQIEISMAGSSPAMLWRYLSCIVIGSMPDEGLEEALFSLRDIWEFYSHKLEPNPIALAPRAINATIVGKKKRPDLVIT